MQQTHPSEGRTRGRGHSHKPQQGQHREAERESGVQERQTKGGSTTGHGTKHPLARKRHTDTTNSTHTNARPARSTDGRYTVAHTGAPTASERRALAPMDGQQGEGEQLTPGAPSRRRPPPFLPRRRPSATPTARNAGSQERMQWGRCLAPTPTRPAPRKHE